MASHSSFRTASLTDEAALWCTRLHDRECTEADRELFRHWLDSDPTHAAEYQAILEIWAISENLPRQNLTQDKPIPPAGLTAAHTPRSRFAVAASLALLIPLASLLGWQLGLLPNAYHRYHTDGQLLRTTLSDGSRVQLNRTTSLSFLNFRDHRQVILHRGEAFFNVQHDAAHPFEVKAGNGRIVVTGTAFNVWKYEGNVVVTLQEGSVKVIGNDDEEDGSSVHLSPGLQARYGKENSRPQIAMADQQETLAWREGKLIINDLTLAEALPLINRYLEQPLVLADQTTGNIRLGGIFNTDDMLGLLQHLPKVLPVRIEQNENGSIVIKKRDNTTSS